MYQNRHIREAEVYVYVTENLGPELNVKDAGLKRFRRTHKGELA